MKVFEIMSFNPSWFLTLPGILITAGVILLLIALILLLSSGKKEEVVENTTAMEQPIPTEPVSTVEPVQVAVPQMPEANIEPPVVDVPTPVQTIETPSVPAAEEIKVEQPVMPEVVTEIKEEPKVEIFAPAQETPVASVNPINFDVPVVNEVPTINAVPTVEEVKVEQPVAVPEVKPAVSIYGGVSPTVDLFKSQSEVKPVIYGGADPLENTAPIPKVDVTPVAEVTQIIEPITNEVPVTATAVMDNSVVDTISAAPSMPEVTEVPQSSPLFEIPATQNVATESVSPEMVKEEIETLDF